MITLNLVVICQTYHNIIDYVPLDKYLLEHRRRHLKSNGLATEKFYTLGNFFKCKSGTTNRLCIIEFML